MSLKSINKNKKYIVGIVVSILLIGISTTFAYFITRTMLSGSGTEVQGTTVSLGDTTVNIEGSLDFNDLDIYPGHKNISKIKVTATGDKNITYNLIWKGTNNLKTSLNYTVYKTTNEQNPSIICEKKQEGNLETIFYEECTESNFTNLGEVVSSGVIPSIQDSSIRLVRNESIQATTSGETVYYYVVLEYPNKETSQNIDMNGSFNGEVTIELIEQEQVCNNYNASTSLGILAVKDCEPGLVLYLDDAYKEKYGIENGDIANKYVMSYPIDEYWTKKPTSGYVYTFIDSNGNDSYDNVLGSFIDSNIVNSSLGKAIWNEEDSTCTFNGDYVASLATGEDVIRKEDCQEVYSVFYVGWEYATGQLIKVGEVRGQDEDGIYATEDNEGTSYYYRGSNPNNWIKFATNFRGQNLYWRIIRINGDGSIRLIYNGTTMDQTGETTQIGVSQFNEKYDDNAYVGYMYGTPGSSTYEETHKNTNDSTVKKYIDNWYEINLLNTEYEKYIDTNSGFCGDRTVNASSKYETGLGYGANKTAYGLYEKYYDHDTLFEAKVIENPSLKCNNNNDYYTVSTSNKGNKALINPIGLISAEEVMRAGEGYFYSTGNNTLNWLRTGQRYWTLSPSHLGIQTFVMLNGSGVQNGIYSVSAGMPNGVRPVINLRADIQLSGSGTTTDPYRIVE